MPGVGGISVPSIHANFTNTVEKTEALPLEGEPGFNTTNGIY